MARKSKPRIGAVAWTDLTVKAAPKVRDFYAGVVYFLNGIAEDLFVPIFALGRVPGWTVQVLEQIEDNILIRPLTLYNGPAPRPYTPIDRR